MGRQLHVVDVGNQEWIVFTLVFRGNEVLVLGTFNFPLHRLVLIKSERQDPRI
jgi:hypothetical protein